MDRAVCVGIDAYPYPNVLKGCVNDISDVTSEIKSACGFDPNNVVTLLDAKATAAAIKETLKEQVALLKNGDRFLFWYSGHGAQLVDRDAATDVICPVDFDFSPAKSVTVQDFHEIFSAIPHGVTAVWGSDSCHSGDLSKDMYGNGVPRMFRRDPSAASKALPKMRRTFKDVSDVMTNIALMAGCHSNQTSADAFIDGRYNGAFTYYLLKVLQGLGGLKKPLTGVIVNVQTTLKTASYAQVPQLSGPPTEVARTFLQASVSAAHASAAHSPAPPAAGAHKPSTGDGKPSAHPKDMVPTQLSKIDHVVVLMLENRSFDHMLGYLYRETRNQSPTGQPFEGVTGNESNPDAHGKPVGVFPIQATQQNAYFMPGANPGEGYARTNSQLFGSQNPPSPPTATCTGFVTDFTYVLGPGHHVGKILPGTVASNIMGIFTPEMLPVLSGLAKGFAVCDHWFASVPTETMPNRAFALAATSQGSVDDKTKSYDVPSIFKRLSDAKVSWGIYGYTQQPLTRHNFPDTLSAPDSNFGVFKDFQLAAANGTLPAFTFLEPSWSSTGNSQHPNYDVALGEQFIYDVYRAVRDGKNWESTLLIITYDEHGGCYDHVPPPQGATPPEASLGENGFDFTRFGVRVPTVLVSPLIEAGTVFRVPDDATPLDHTSILKTVEQRWNLPALTARDAAASGIGQVLTRSAARKDDPLANVRPPSTRGPSPFSSSDPPSHLEQVHAELVSRLPVPGEKGLHVMPTLRTSDDAQKYISERTEVWMAGRRQGG
jgi:phospholipase C